jgi:pimeloyl-ACP methyl ester carboxylesterase
LKPTLIFLHGAGSVADVFAAQTRAFDSSIALALPGHGVPGQGETIEEFANYVQGVCDEREWHDIVLVGSSMGGAIALELAIRGDARIRGVALIGSGAKLRVSPAIFEAIRTDFEAASRMLAQSFYAEPTPPLIEKAVGDMRLVGAQQTERDFRACNAFDVTGNLDRIQVPLVSLTGEHDVMVPPKFGAFVADRVPGASARILPGAGHLAMVERPADTNDALSAFVTQIGS